MSTVRSPISQPRLKVSALLATGEQAVHVLRARADVQHDRDRTVLSVEFVEHGHHKLRVLHDVDPLLMRIRRCKDLVEILMQDAPLVVEDFGGSWHRCRSVSA
jgi:hypothetical protein